MTEQIGRVVGGRYRLRAHIGTGLSTEVYLAEDVTLGRRVAVKLLHPALTDNEALLNRFREETRNVEPLRHRHVAAVYAWGEDDGPFLVMEFLGGGTLQSMLDQGTRLTPSQALVVGLHTAQALDFGKQRGFVHSDMKPANLLFDDDGRLCVAKLGLAGVLSAAAWSERDDHEWVGLHGPARRQAQDGLVDGEADLHGLVLVLIEAVTGRMRLADDSIAVPASMGPLTSVLERVGSPDSAERHDAKSLAMELHQAASQLARPAPLRLAGTVDLRSLKPIRQTSSLAWQSPSGRGSSVSPTSSLSTPCLPPTRGPGEDSERPDEGPGVNPGEGFTNRISLRERSRWTIPGLPRLPLLPTALMLILAQLLGMWAWQNARTTNSLWLEASSDYNFESPRAEPIDLYLDQFTQLIYGHHCEIGRSELCTDYGAASSPALAALDLEALPVTSRELLDEHGYTSADHLLETLLFNRQQAHVPQTLLALVDTGELPAFAIHQFLFRWYLGPAMGYHRAGRAEDSSALFLHFVEAELVALNSGTRLAGVEGVDIVDLPILFQAFCQTPESSVVDQKRCALPFLTALTAPTEFWLPLDEGIPSFLANYREAPGQNEALVSYLEMEQDIGELGAAVGTSDPTALPLGARHLGYYVKGRHLLAVAKSVSARERCIDLVGEALEEFRLAGLETERNSAFGRVITRETEAALEDSPCALDEG